MPKQLIAPRVLPSSPILPEQEGRDPLEAAQRRFEVNAVRAAAREKLKSTDWRVTRAAERGDPIPDAWSAWRDELRALATLEDVGGELPPLPIEPAWQSDPSKGAK